ncbi:unnamed protein product [Moneuplotes crassus]|uniref:Uncharacterized protein n=1 Tax=Euplotes crassus TaxID=5936 RepID=A0AAD1ULJ5_EUPCR|nr:unnamed protein product [Moneuplotes crassus]
MFSSKKNIKDFLKINNQESSSSSSRQQVEHLSLPSLSKSQRFSCLRSNRNLLEIPEIPKH